MSAANANVISIVDDDESIRAATRTLLRSVGYRQVRTFASAELFLNSGALLDTGCLILDVRMPGIDGLELQRRLNAVASRIPIIFVTAHDDSTNRRRAIEAGAVAFLNKPFEANVLVAALREALGSERIEPDLLAGREDTSPLSIVDCTDRCSNDVDQAVDQCQLSADSRDIEKRNAERCALTTRELEILRLICEGYSTKVIAAKLGIRFKTAVTHRTHLLRKAGVHDSISLLRWAVSESLVSIPNGNSSKYDGQRPEDARWRSMSTNECVRGNVAARRSLRASGSG